MQTIFKYPLEMQDLQKIEAPKGAKFLRVQMQESLDGPALWAYVDSDADPEERVILITGTGKEIKVDPKKLRFLDTFQMSDGALVWHVFEVVP